MSDQGQPSAVFTSQIGSAAGSPQRRRHREQQIQSAYEIQRDAAVKGALIYTAIGASACVMAHHLFPAFRRQTLAFKSFLTSGATIFGLVVGADTVLLSHEGRQRSEEEMIRRRARTELGRQGIVASETNIEKWKDDVRSRILREREESRRSQGAEDSQGPTESLESHQSQDETSVRESKVLSELDNLKERAGEAGDRIENSAK